MLRERHSFLFSLIGSALMVLLLAFVFSCSDQPTAPSKDGEQGDLSGNGTINPAGAASFLLGSVSDSSVAPGYIEVWASNVAFDSDSGFVTFDVKLVNRCLRKIMPPVHFVVTNIIPRDIALVGFDGVSPDGFPFFDFSSKLGGDNVLEPGESSEGVTLKFHTVTARSFAIGFRIDLGGPSGPGLITGFVFRDDNENGTKDQCFDVCDPGIPGITVALEKPLQNGDKVTLLTRSDLNGAYSFGSLREGVYKVFVVASPDRWRITSTNPLLITLVKGPDGQVQNFTGADFGLYPLVPPLPERLFGPVLVGPFAPIGTTLDSTFVNPPSPLTVVFHHYLDVSEPPFEWPIRVDVDSASAWINDVLVFAYRRSEPPDTAYFGQQTIALPDSLVKAGENTIRLFTDGDEHAALMWTVYRKP
jgi:hypothetical protein